MTPDGLRRAAARCFVDTGFSGFVIPAQAGIHITALDFRLRGNDKTSRL
jgi:hypothetical protein